MGSPEAEVRSETERDVRVGSAVEPDGERLVEHRAIEIGRGPAEGDSPPRLDGNPVDLGGDRADAADVRQRHEHPEELFCGVDDPVRGGPEEGEVGRRAGEVADRAGDRVDDRVAAAGEGEIGEAEHLGAVERPAAEARLREEAEEIVARGSLGPIEAVVEVVVELAGFGEAVVAMEDMDSPADPNVGFRLGHVEEDGERQRLERQGEPFDDLDRVAGERLVKEAGDDPVDAADEGRLLGPEEEGFDEPAVVGVVGGIEFDRQLADAAELLLRRDRHPERGVGAEGMPVLRGPANLLVAEDHRDLISLKRTAEHAVSLTGLAEWIVDRGHEGASAAVG